MPIEDKHDFDFDCCEIPEAVEARTIETGCDRRAFSSRNLRAGEVILRNFPTAYKLLRDYEEKHCARCLSSNRRQEQFEQSQQRKKLLRCGGCKQVWYCSRDCQKRDFFSHKVECKQHSILLASTGKQDADSSEAINNAALLVRNFLALRVPQICDKTNNCSSRSSLHENGNIVFCGKEHFDNLIEYNREYELENQETLDIQRASRALWNQRKAINKSQPSDIIHSRSDLEEQLESDLRRFRANNFGVTDSMVRVVASAVYPLGALLNHSCAPNCLLRYDFCSSSCEPPVMEIVAARDVSKGEELTHSYVELVSSMQSRRASLRDIFGFDCHCTKCSCRSHNDLDSCTTTAATRFKISLPFNHRSLSPIELSRWALRNYNPFNSKLRKGDDSSLELIDQDMILQHPDLNNINYMTMAAAANAKQQQAQYYMVTGDLKGELASLKEAVQIFETFLADTGNLQLTLDLYKARCTRFGSLIIAGGEFYTKEALIECEHIVSFLCLALKHVPNHSLLGLQLFTLGDIYEANGERESAHSTYTWARKILRISQGNRSEMVIILNEKIG